MTSAKASRDQKTMSVASLSSTLSYIPGAGAIRRVKRKNASTAFNLMVVGFQGLGKTSFLRLLYQTLNTRDAEREKGMSSSRASIASLANLVENQQPLPKFLTNKRRLPKRTNRIVSATVPVRHDGEKIQLNLIDTPGLSLENELVLDNQVTEILRYIEAKLDDTLSEEAKVRRSKAREKYDPMIHVVLYFMDPITIFEGEAPVRPTLKRSNSTAGSGRRRSASTASRPSTAVGTNGAASAIADEEDDSEEDDDEKDPLPQAQATPKANAINPDGAVGLSAKDLRILRRLSQRVNVIPILPMADTLTTRQLAACREKIRQDLQHHDIDIFQLGDDLFGEGDDEDEDEDEDDSQDDADESSKTEQDDNGQGPTAVSSHVPFVLIAPEPPLDTAPIDESITPTRPLSPPASPPKLTHKDKESATYTRSYPWGTLDCLNPDHTDFKLLQRVLLTQPNLNRLRQVTGEYYYERFRTERLTARKISQAFGDKERRKLMEDLGRI